jgi:hypothetical protein
MVSNIPEYFNWALKITISAVANKRTDNHLIFKRKGKLAGVWLNTADVLRVSSGQNSNQGSQLILKECTGRLLLGSALFIRSHFNFEHPSDERILGSFNEL